MAAADAAPLAHAELRLYWQPTTSDQRPRRQRIDLLLRGVLAPLLGLSADALVFAREAKGRPFLRHRGAPDFNLSDTDGGTLIAVTATGRVGVDLERSNREPPVLRLAARWFGAEEAAVLATLSSEQARRAFLRCWTAKEASCKATGTGIYGYLSQWRFDPVAESVQLQSLPADAGAAARWRFHRLMPTSEHTAVLALLDAGDLPITAYTLADEMH